MANLMIFSSHRTIKFHFDDKEIINNILVIFDFYLENYYNNYHARSAIVCDFFYIYYILVYENNYLKCTEFDLVSSLYVTLII